MKFALNITSEGACDLKCHALELLYEQNSYIQSSKANYYLGTIWK